MSPAAVTYCTIDTPIGELLIAATQTGVVRVAFQNEHFNQVLAELAKRVGPVKAQDSATLTTAATQLQEYFTGHRHVFDLPLDLRLTTVFQQKVLDALLRIPFGHKATYTQIATELHNPGAIRAVGTACARNPLPILIPCHRVVRSDGTTGGYLGGTQTKTRLLRLETR